jgi:hypothetical protein
VSCAKQARCRAVSMQGQAKEGVGYVNLRGYVQQVNLAPYL